MIPWFPDLFRPHSIKAEMCLLLYIPVNLELLTCEKLVSHGLVKQNEALKAFGRMVSACLRTNKVNSMSRLCWLCEFKSILTWVVTRHSYSFISTAWGNCSGFAIGWQLSELSKSYFVVVEDYHAFKRTLSIHIQGIWIGKCQRWLSKEIFGRTTGKMWGGDKIWLYFCRKKSTKT